VLYTLTRPTAEAAFGATPEQAQCAARVMSRLWNGLERGDATDLVPCLAPVAQRTVLAEGQRGLEERMLRENPTLTDLLAWLWSRASTPATHASAFDVARGARLREIGAAMRRRSVPQTWLYGAGAHTAWVLDHAREIGIPIVGIADDALAGTTRFGRTIASPSEIPPGQHVLLSSDWHEDALWLASESIRSRGVHVWRFYADPLEPSAQANRARRSA
jgi:hypothetical protein